MKIFLSNRERVAGLFLLFGIVGVIAFVVGAAIQNRWLEPRTPYHVHVSRGEGLREGSPIFLSGIQVGEVGSLTILPDNRIDVEILIRNRHVSRVKVGTTVEVRRVLGIGEKRIHLTSGSKKDEVLKAGSLLKANEPMDILDAISNLDLGQYLKTLDRAVAALELTLDKLEEGNRIERMMEAFDKIGPTMERMDHLFSEIDEPLSKLISDPSVVRTFRGADRVFNDPNTRRAMKSVAGSFKPEKISNLMARTESLITRFDNLLAEGGHFEGAMAGFDRLMNDGRMDRMLTAMERLSDPEKLEKLIEHMSSLARQMAKVGPEIPTLTREMIVTMREAVVVLKALQKTWLLEDETHEVLKEIRAKKNEKKKKR